MCEAAPGSVEAIKTAAQVITLRESRPPWGFVEAQLLWKLKEISDRICKAVWKGFTEQMLADYSFKSKEPLPFLPSPLRPQGLCPGPSAMATQHRRWPHLCRDPSTGVLIALPCRYHPLEAADSGSPSCLRGVTCSGVGSWPTLTSAHPTLPERSVRTQQIMSIYLAPYMRKYVEI